MIAQLAEPRSAIELAGMLHPTPAVGGEPWPAAAAPLTELEQLDRGWYAAPVGWMDATEDGEFCVALRSALLRDRDAHLFAGVGVVAGSDPEAELAETEVKLQAMLPLLATRAERGEDAVGGRGGGRATLVARSVRTSIRPVPAARASGRSARDSRRR